MAYKKEKVCSHCKKIYLTRSHKSLWCSDECRYAKDTAKNCVGCGQEFKAVNLKAKGRSYCSRDCGSKNAKREYPKLTPNGNCHNCKTIISNGKLYCSRECQHIGRFRMAMK